MECKQCLYNSSHPFGLSFKDELCSGCITHKEKYELDWGKKYEDLKFIVKNSKNFNSYDCVIPVTGDAEDFFVVNETLRLKLNPLIVCVNSYFLNDIGWKNIHTLITNFDLDSWIYNPDITVYKELVRTSLRKYNHMYLPWLQLHTSFPVHVAREKNINLIIWGGQQSVEQVGKFSHIDNVEMSSWSRTEHDLFNNNIHQLTGNGAQVAERDLNYYNYPEVKGLGKKVKGIYLSNFIPWDPIKQNHSTLKYGFTPQENPYSFDIYERAGSSIYYHIHDVLKYERIGYRKIRDHCTREVRHGRLTTEEASIIEGQYKNRKVFIRDFFDWLGVTKSGYEWFIKHRLEKSKELISENRNIISKAKIDFPEKLSKFIVEAKSPKREFIVYGKGIKIR